MNAATTLTLRLPPSFYEKPNRLATHAQLTPDTQNCLREICPVGCEQILTISNERHFVRWGTFSAADIRKVEGGIRVSLALS